MPVRVYQKVIPLFGRGLKLRGPTRTVSMDGTNHEALTVHRDPDLFAESRLIYHQFRNAHPPRLPE